MGDDHAAGQPGDLLDQCVGVGEGEAGGVAANIERLTRARDICGEALLHRRGSTDAGWTELREVRNRIAGQLARRRLRPSGKVDVDNNPIPVRRHHPDHPERIRPGRFILAP